jgi:hypothetical protein
MNVNDAPGGKVIGRWKYKGCIAAIAIVSFAAGSLIAARTTHASTADADRVFELRVYHAVPGKVPALEARFRDATSLFAKHNLNVLGYWVPSGNPAWENTFVYLLAHTSRDQAKRNWKAFHQDPAFQKFVKSERAEKLIESDSNTYMRPTDYSSMK